ncbi:amino acid adenylation domain-containing protein [Micromonospora sp. NIE79]|uniref:Amino acid adenylation domain-containing protein n=1 Tax=Micromonospora trifolii TaxID=2911208 RepID=A0ABS9MWB9_9ACTN|nr:amino acid adenylation domain-containing protein [Micromonospora trifolii]MCG5442010.1 amino acid adenylation domain-containing protein [Micromonospora trifolii]
MTQEWTFPASFAQERVWTANQLDPGSPVFNISAPFGFPAGVTATQVAEALTQVVARHEALRTHLRMADGVLTQVVRAVEPVELPELDLTDLPADEQQARATDTLAELARTPIPLDAPPLWRARLVRFAADRLGLQFVVHHAVFDSHSAVLFDAELAAFTRAALTGAPADVPELPIQYADFAVWQRDQLTDDELDRQLAFWRGSLAGAPTVTGLPLDRPRPAQLGFAGDEVRFDLPDGLLDRVGQLAAGTSATPYMVLLATFAALLSRISGDPQVVVGVSTAGRDAAELAPLIGMFVNPVAVSCDLSGDPSGTELVGRVRAGLVDAMEHGQTPFQRIVEAVAAHRDPSVQPVFQTALNFIPDSGLDVVALGTTKDDLAFDITRGTSRLVYRTDLFDRATAETVVARYLRLLTAVVADPATRLSALPLLDDAERDLLRTWAGTGGEVVPTTVVAEVQRQAAATPAAAALLCDGVELSYAEMSARANRLARLLVERGAGPETRVALLLPRSVELLVAILAVLKAGAAYLPVDTDHPANRIGYLLTDAEPTLVLATPQTAALAPADALVLDSTTAADLDDTDLLDDDRRSPLRPEHPAYVLYTSGSTGRPKGVLVEHRAVAAYLAWARDTYPGLAGTALLHSPVTFDLTVTGLLGPLTVGGTVRLAGIDTPAARAGGPPTFLKVTPSHLPLLDDALSPTTDLVIGGEALTGDQLAGWRAAHPQVAVINEYGPTEATVGCVAARIAPGQSVPAGPVPIGQATWTTRVHLLDAALNPVPPGVVGELYVAGAQLARGYLRRPALTAERFLPCPYGPPGERMYRTGDLARWRADGTLEYLGRRDNQVKVRGMRIELGEIESVLRARPDVDAATVVVRADGGESTLVGYLVGPVDTAALAADLALELPAHMVPTAFVVLDALPLTPNGKLDSAALPAPAVAATDGFLAPRTDAEALVAEVYADVLQVEKVGVLDDFFALGGNSLRGMRAMARIRAEVDVELPMRALFSSPVVADLAAQIEQQIAAELDELSETEVAALLVAEKDTPS